VKAKDLDTEIVSSIFGTSFNVDVSLV